MNIPVYSWSTILAECEKQDEPTRRGTANLPGSGRDSWPPRHATPAAFSVSTETPFIRVIGKGGREGGREEEKEAYLNLERLLVTNIFQTPSCFGSHASLENIQT